MTSELSAERNQQYIWRLRSQVETCEASCTNPGDELPRHLQHYKFLLAQLDEVKEEYWHRVGENEAWIAETEGLKQRNARLASLLRRFAVVENHEVTEECRDSGCIYWDAAQELAEGSG